MSIVTDSSVHSSSSDDFAALLDAELDGISSESSPEQEEEEEDDDDDDLDPELERMKKRKMEKQYDIGTETSTLIDECEHPGFFGAMCFKCGKVMDVDSGVKLGYIHQQLRLGNDEIARVRNKDVNTLLRHKKLYLVLDLDHTLLNSTLMKDVTADEEYLRCSTDSLQDKSLFVLTSMHMMTKLRPFAYTFLKEASKMFDMYIYTMGDRFYASEMAKLLDPKREYFVDKVISRDESTQKHQKGLDLLLGHESAAMILDDTESVWSDHKDNLILMERYNYFASSLRQFGFTGKSLSEMRTDESEEDGALATALNILRQIHNIFYDEETNSDPLASRDVRKVLKCVQKQILKNCKIVFSRVFPESFQAENHPLWKMAEQMGATCSTVIDPSVTHVISRDVETKKARWAVKEKKFLVNLQWIEAAKFRWKRQPEENFAVEQMKNKKAAQ